ncbi:MAG TPA: hypothetical protein VMF69_04010, partial [Gemmataceae bacterium]|nr:hypothetical protein [Gemmataceae bacterium]
MDSTDSLRPRLRFSMLLLLACGAIALLALVLAKVDWRPVPLAHERMIPYRRRKHLGAGFSAIVSRLRWDANASLPQIAALWDRVGYRFIADIDRFLVDDHRAADKAVPLALKAVLYNYEGEPRCAAEVFSELRRLVEADDALAADWLYTIIFYQGVT